MTYMEEVQLLEKSLVSVSVFYMKKMAIGNPNLGTVKT